MLCWIVGAGLLNDFGSRGKVRLLVKSSQFKFRTDAAEGEGRWESSGSPTT